MDSSTELIKAKIDIYSIVSEYVSLKKAGKNYKGLCPFHGEKTPSFMVNPERNIFKCFGCNEGGDIFTFVEKIEGISFTDALRMLAKRAGVELTQVEVTPEEKEKETLYKINTLSTEFYHYLLVKHPVAKEAREYLKSRQVADSTSEDFQLGFAPRQRDVLTQFLKKKGFNPQQMIHAGVTLPDGGGYKDRFYSRLLFPIKNMQGQVVGFSGRILGDGEPKYLNSPDSPIFNKSKLLFAMDKAKTEVKKAQEIILVEGNFDVILSHQVGVKNVVAPLGTALGEDQIGLVKRFTENLSFCFDTDSAGRAATIRGIEMAENAGLSVSTIKPEAGKDPSDCINQNPDLWKQSVAAKTPVLDFYLDTFITRFGAASAEGKRKIETSFLPILGRIHDPVLRTHYLQKMAALLQVEEEVLFKELTRFQSNSSTIVMVTRQETGINAKNQVEKYLLALILQSKFLPSRLKETDFHDPIYSAVKTALEGLLAEKKEKLVLEDLLEKLNEGEKTGVNELLLLDIGEAILLDDQKILTEIESCITRIKEVNLRLNLKKLSLAVKQAEASGDTEKLASLNNEFRDLSQQLVSTNQGGN